MKIQKDEVLSFVKSEREQGRVLSEILVNLKIARSTYYRWAKLAETGELSKIAPPRVTSRSITEKEFKMIDDMKIEQPEMRHRQIQGLLQLGGAFVSSSTVYKYLKQQNKVEPYERRSAPWKEPLYEVIGANIMWGADWTKLRIGGLRWYLLTLIDFFSRYIVHHEVVPTVNAAHIKALYESGLGVFNIPLNLELKPELRLDRGSPNTSRVTKEFFKDINADLSFARVRRPTDNARTERFYRTIKQEEIYIVGDYQDELTAKEEIGAYIRWYNEKRPHQALWNFTPWLVHDTNNKTRLLETLRVLKQKSWSERKEYWQERKDALAEVNQKPIIKPGQ
jgi:transposase InsO family protein